MRSRARIITTSRIAITAGKCFGILVDTQVPSNKQLQRTVIPQHVRAAGAALPLCACGAHDTSSRGR